MLYKNILVPVDFSVNSVQAFDYSLQLARQHEALLHILHVIDPLLYTGFSEISEELLMKTRLNNANEELRKFVDEIPHPGVEIIENLRIGKPHQQIINFSRHNNIDAIVIASHGWTGKYHLTTGSVAGKIMKLSKVPVICVKANSSSYKRNNIIINSSALNNRVV
jgi:nucleotide-binding universal stress UspA family protein